MIPNLANLSEYGGVIASAPWVWLKFCVASGAAPPQQIWEHWGPGEVGTAVILVGLVVACSVAWARTGRSKRRALAQLSESEEAREKLKLQLDTVRFRTSRLREELLAANTQARLSHQLSLLGQFTAGFMHEFNNPLAIVEGRLEVLREERKQDAALLADIDQMLKETRYMGQIARTLLQALRRERGAEVFEASDPASALKEAVAATQAKATEIGIALIAELQEGPRADVPEHVVVEVVRGLLNNALKALDGREQARVWVRLAPYRSAGTKILISVEDNGPGVPEEIRAHLFEPFVSQSSGREGLGLGLFLAASLLDMYDGTIRYENREGGGARFAIELPPARFTRDQPYHWFATGTSE
ncbi:MAG: sensor histidine kinase [Acidobacteriota bacterium]